MTENKTILSVKDLRFTYSGQEKPALDGVTLEVRRGDFLRPLRAVGKRKVDAFTLPEAFSHTRR